MPTRVQLPRSTGTTLDVVLALFVTGLSLWEMRSGQIAAPLVGGTLVALVFGGCMLTWRRYPFATLLAAYGGIVLCVVLDVSLDNFLGSVIPGVLVVASLAADSALPKAVVGGLVGYVVLLLTALGHSGGWLWGAFLLLSAFAAGRMIRSRRLLIERLRATTSELERTRDQQTRVALAQERTRIARELHDVVAHAVSVMVVQAGAAQRMVAVGDGASADGALDSVQGQGREALVELRRLLDVLRDEADDRGAMAPQPGLDALETLTEPVRRAGLAVSVERSGRARPLAPGIELAAYRILQEALTNVLKHARAATATVCLDYGEDALALEVRDDGSGGPGGIEVPGGHGLVGMAERAGMYGGRVESGRLDGGGFRVHAWLPLKEQA
jgi:signal transduction histidine kinase